jgi:hypothetical protein
MRVKGQLNEWFATHRPEDIMDDIQSGRVTFLETDLVSYSCSLSFEMGCSNWDCMVCRVKAAMMPAMLLARLLSQS